MGKRLSLFYKIFGAILLILLIYNEFIIYPLNSWTWTKLGCKNETSCVKILLVADPQLIGEQNEIYHSITPISIWDSDRYLRKTYSLVVDHFSPDVIIFLGDLFDEGSIANPVQYIRYIRRLFNIFTTEFPIRHIWIPGDNDIGGENFEHIAQEKINRFENTFSQPPVIDVKHVRFTKVNRMVRDTPRFLDYVKNNSKLDVTSTSVVVSHMPLVLVPASFVDKVVKILKPNIIFAAHEHKSILVRTNIWQQYRKVDDLSKQNNQIHEYKLDHDKIFEIIAPTCSYRMGTDNIGYGAAIIENNETLRYTVFWSPKRFIYLKSYYILTILIILYFLLTYIYKKMYRPRIIISKQQYPYKIIKNGV